MKRSLACLLAPACLAAALCAGCAFGPQATPAHPPVDVTLVPETAAPVPAPSPTPAPTPVIAPRKVQTLPQTGDGFPLLAIVVVSLASATGIVLLTVKQKNALKETSDEEDADESSDR